MKSKIFTENFYSYDEVNPIIKNNKMYPSLTDCRYWNVYVTWTTSIYCKSWKPFFLYLAAYNSVRINKWRFSQENILLAAVFTGLAQSGQD